MVAFGNDAMKFGPELVTLFHSSIALMERPSQERDPAVKLKRDHTETPSFHNLDATAMRSRLLGSGAGSPHAA
jgi:hypothetical protein